MEAHCSGWRRARLKCSAGPRGRKAGSESGLAAARRQLTAGQGETAWPLDCFGESVHQVENLLERDPRLKVVRVKLQGLFEVFDRGFDILGADSRF